jgi:hypothetical protein
MRVSDYNKKDAIQILVSKDSLKQFITRTTNAEIKNTVLLLLREFGSSIFQAPVKISIGHLSPILEIPEIELKDSLIILDNMGIVSFKPSIPKETIKLSTERVISDRLVLNYRLLNESYLHSRRKLDKMIEFVFAQDCRFKFILNYFGETLENYKCGKCDNCLSTDKISESTTEYISHSILRTLQEANEELSEKALLQILRGEYVKESLNKFDCFGACKKYSVTEIRIVIHEMVSKKEIIKSLGKRNYFSLNKIVSTKSKRKQLKETSTAVKNYDDDLYLFNLLREVRKRAAERFMQSGYLICSDNILHEIVRSKPASKHELLSIKGFNNRMLNKVGDDFLEIVNKYLKDKAAIKTDSKKSSIPKNILETQKLLNRKYTLKEIANALRLSEAVVSMQIETIIEYDPESDVSHLYNKEIYGSIISEVKKGYENLKDLKERLPSKITYPQIRIAAAKHKFTFRHQS